jgi:hypothetical protein
MAVVGGLPCARLNCCFRRHDEPFTAMPTRWRWNSIRDSDIRHASGSTSGVTPATTKWNGSHNFRCSDSFRTET